MKSNVLAAAFAVALGVATGAAQAAPVRLQVTDLNGVSVDVPANAPKDRTLLLLGFRHEDNKALEVWRQSLGLQAQDTDWYEVPVIGVGNAMIRSMIVRGMQHGVTGTAERARFAPAFADAAGVARQLEVDPAQPAVVVLDRTGRVLARASGAFDPAKARLLTAALRP